VDVARMGPGIGTGGQHGQTDYRLATRGGGHGGYHCIVLAPQSCQEVFDLVQLAFYLADTYRIMVIVLSDFIIGRMAEPVEARTLDFGPVPDKTAWALMGKGKRGGKAARRQTITLHPIEPQAKGVPGFHLYMREKYQRIEDKETRFQTYRAEDASLLIASYGSSARAAWRAVDLAREQGLRVGLFRPISVWPFPKVALREAALRAGKVLVVEDSIGEFVDDVEFAVQGRVPVHLLGVWGRHEVTGSGLIHPERIVEEVKTIYG